MATKEEGELRGKAHICKGNPMAWLRGGGDARRTRIQAEVAEAPSAMAAEQGHGSEIGGTGAFGGERRIWGSQRGPGEEGIRVERKRELWSSGARREHECEGTFGRI